MFMSKMFRKKLFGQKKGFTLIELMIVIAIIGILALVLIPQASKMRDNARLAGVDANMRIVQAQAEAVIDDASTADELINILSTRIGNMVKNPFNSSDRCVPVTAVSFNLIDSITNFYVNNDAVFICKTGTDPDGIFASGSGSIPHNDNLKGTVVAAVYTNNNVLTVKIYGFDKDGNARTTSSKAKVVSK